VTGTDMSTGRGSATGVGRDLPVSLDVLPVADLPPAGPQWRAWLTDAEMRYCLGFQRAAEHGAARLAAKRAASRALGWPVARLDVPWSDVEVTREAGQPPRVTLCGALEAWQHEAGLPVPATSLTHAAGYAAALAWLPGAVP